MKFGKRNVRNNAGRGCEHSVVNPQHGTAHLGEDLNVETRDRGLVSSCKGKTPVVDEPNDGVSFTTWGSSLDIY